MVCVLTSVFLAESTVFLGLLPFIGITISLERFLWLVVHRAFSRFLRFPGDMNLGHILDSFKSFKKTAEILWNNPLGQIIYPDGPMIPVAGEVGLSWGHLRPQPFPSCSCAGDYQPIPEGMQCSC